MCSSDLLVRGTPEDDTLRGLLERLWLAPASEPGVRPATGVETKPAP